MAPPFRCTSGTTGSPSIFHGTAGSLPCFLGSILAPLAVAQDSLEGRRTLVRRIQSRRSVCLLLVSCQAIAHPVANVDGRSNEFHSK